MSKQKETASHVNEVSCPSLMSRTCTRSGPRPRGACRRCGARRGRTRARSASCPRTRAPRHCGTSGQTGSGHAWAPLDTQMRPALPQQQIPDEKKVYPNMIVILLLYNSRFKTLANKQLTQLESSPTQYLSYYVSTYKLVESKSKPALCSPRRPECQ